MLPPGTAPETSAIVRVFDRRGLPLLGVTVQVDTQAAQTDARGYVAFTSVAPESEILVDLSGYYVGQWRLDALGTSPQWSTRPPHLGTAHLVLPCPVRWCVDLELAPVEARGIYIPQGILRSPKRFWGLVRMVDESPVLNAVVIDVKGDYGLLSWQSQVPLAQEMDNHFPTRVDLAEAVAELRRRGIYTIARFVVFKDDPLATHKPEWAVKRGDGTVWKDAEGLGWANPFREEVWNYNLDLLAEVARLGFDEVQLDYIRFPSDGDIGAIVYEEENTRETRTAAIREFMRRFAERMGEYGVKTSADVFGLTLWVVPGEDMNIGQRVEDIAPHVHYLSPMIYPSTFIPGNLGYKEPSKKPYEIIYRSVKQARTRVPAHVRIRPWLQAYWYTLPEMQIQRLAAEEAAADGWLYWNASGVYPPELFGPLPDREELWKQVYGSQD